MSQEWMLDVLSDLRSAAHKQAMYQLAELIDDAMMVAADELRTMSGSATVTGAHEDMDGDLPRPLAEREHT
ncbi:MAG: hypothetical protein AAGE76_09480 [Pseudomonadota bacterium]